MVSVLSVRSAPRIRAHPRQSGHTSRYGVREAPLSPTWSHGRGTMAATLSRTMPRRRRAEITVEVGTVITLHQLSPRIAVLSRSTTARPAPANAHTGPHKEHYSVALPRALDNGLQKKQYASEPSEPRTLRPSESVGERGDLGVAEAAQQVVVGEAGGLHVGVHDRRADEAEPAPSQLPRQGA